MEINTRPSGPVAGWPPGAWIAVAGLSLVGFSGPNRWLAVIAILGLVAGIRMLWRPGEPPILLFIFCYQWLQASIAIFHANSLGLPIDRLSTYGANMQTASLLSLLACLSIAAGLRVGAGKPIGSHISKSVAWVKSVPLERWFRFYLIAFGAAVFLQAFSWAIPGLRQILLSLASLKWAFFWMLAYAASIHGRQRSLFWIAFAIEFIVGIGGYFSGFKTVIIFSLLAMATSQLRVNVRKKWSMLGAIVLVLLMGSIWSAIKEEYRQYISAGTGQQIVVVSASERMNKLGSLIADMDAKKLVEGWDKMLRRMTYVEFFGVVLNRVPRVVGHTNGALWFDAVRRPLMPRLLFPSKSAVNDSELVNRFTGLGVAGAAQGTSISLGVPAETYIDFGPWLMFVPLFLLGFASGRLYRYYLVSPRTRGPLGMGFACTILFPLALMETSILKLFAALILNALAAWVLIRFVVPRYLRWLVPAQFSR